MQNANTKARISVPAALNLQLSSQHCGFESGIPDHLPHFRTPILLLVLRATSLAMLLDNMYVVAVTEENAQGQKSTSTL